MRKNSHPREKIFSCRTNLKNRLLLSVKLAGDG
ncbi:hypothetical protein M2480_001505 [Parabacteroides sp. PFB2-12]|nr:hypothetical protein [Parabacteroides sp. PM6-13]MDH6390530.1 hypothetical protein [Parabacteroides sp. PFB2-12]